MSDEKDETVFQPSQFGPASKTAQQPWPDAPSQGSTPTADDEGTVFAAGPAPKPASSGTGTAQGTEEGTVFAQSLPAAPITSSAPSPPPPPPTAARRPSASIAVGTVLNHMFEVKRFLARGGMGEVFEGVNIASSERVAIKTILPELAADPNVMAMFQKEAQALTQLSHPAVVRYRGFALEPTLGLYYIATGFIDGSNLSDLLGKSTLSEDELFALTRKLAEGLREAHELGVVHRDISPDNVLLDGDRLDRPKIIDFGIVKETDPGSKTIIGDGFAGKPSYVAPEQLGDFDKQVGPWSDVYSLALVTLAMAQGRKPDLGGLPAEAIMKRRNGVDTAVVPGRLRAVIDRMLVADPQKRLRSMDDVIAALDQARAGKAPKAKKTVARSSDNGGAKAPSKGLLIGGVATVCVAVFAGIAYLVASKSETPAQQASIAPPLKNVSREQVNAAVQSTLPGTPCSWLTIDARQDGTNYTITATGVAGDPIDANNRILQGVRKLGVEPGTDSTGVARIDASYCPILDELQKFRSSSPERMTRKQPEYELDRLEDSSYKGELGTHVVTDISLDGVTEKYSLYAVEKSNVITQIVADDTVLNSMTMKLPGKRNHRLDIATNAQLGWSGIVLITGKGGFTADALSNLTSPAGRAAFEQRARANDWKVQMVWYKFVDNLPNNPGGPPSATATP